MNLKRQNDFPSPSGDIRLCRAGARRSQEVGSQESRGCYSRGYLPHVDYPGLLQSITYRLADSLPPDGLEQIQEELRFVKSQSHDVERRRRIEEWLDSGHGSCLLRDARVADCVLDTWLRFAGERYDLIAWVVMPNHVHVLIRIYEGVSLSKIVQSWKSYTGRKINEGLREKPCRAGAQRSQGGRSPVWQREYWDRFIRNETHFNAAVAYIHHNPVKAGLVKEAERWAWSSARQWAND
jgi:putative transposase